MSRSFALWGSSHVNLTRVGSVESMRLSRWSGAGSWRELIVMKYHEVPEAPMVWTILEIPVV